MKIIHRFSAALVGKGIAELFCVVAFFGHHKMECFCKSAVKVIFIKLPAFLKCISAVSVYFELDNSSVSFTAFKNLTVFLCVSVTDKGNRILFNCAVTCSEALFAQHVEAYSRKGHTGCKRAFRRVKLIFKRHFNLEITL